MDTSLLGQPVELAQIPRELNKLWESSGGTKSRASLVNFAVCAEGAEALEGNTRLISEFTREHACRAILVANVPEAPAGRVQAWINAHCHLARAGAKQVCCEQITVLIEGEASGRLANILFANLDSDLPLYLWWQAPFRASLPEQLWRRVDRLIFDSGTWADPREQFAQLRGALERSGARVILCDLNWTRSLQLRQAVAQMFDHPENLALIPRLRSIRFMHAPGHRLTALLLAAWIAAQLKWTGKAASEAGMSWTTQEGEEVCGELREAAGAPVALCELSADGATISVRREAGSPHLRAEVRLPDGRSHCHLLPAGPDDLCGLLNEELMRGGKHLVYQRALAALGGLL